LKGLSSSELIIMSRVPEPYYLAFIDEVGDPGLKGVRPIDPSGRTEWLCLGAVVVRASRDADIVPWSDRSSMKPAFALGRISISEICRIFESRSSAQPLQSCRYGLLSWRQTKRTCDNIEMHERNVFGHSNGSIITACAYRRSLTVVERLSRRHFTTTRTRPLPPHPSHFGG
jgi:hypothetical protein